MHHHHNGLRTALLLGALSALVMATGALLAGSRGLVLGLGVALLSNAFAYFNSDKLALRAMRAYPVSEAQQPVLYRVVRELSTSARAPMPRLYVSPTAAPNAFATGRNPRNAAVCATEGILAVLDERELRGVLGHELAHVHNRDVLICSVAAGLASMVMMLAHFGWLVPLGRSQDDDGGGVVGALLLVVLGPAAAVVIRLALSRSREYEADAASARATGDPMGLASALRKLDAGTRALPLPPEPRLQSAGALMIADPFGPQGLSRLFATHPPMAERIARLEELAGYRR